MVGPRTWTLRERWHSKVEEPHYTETSDDLMYFSICQNSSADLNSTITVLVQSYRVKHFPIWYKGANDISLLSTEEWGRRCFFFNPSPLFLWLQKGSPLSTWARSLLPAHLYLLQVSCINNSVKLLQSCLTLYNLTNCSLPGSSVHGILQARILEWVAMLSSRGTSWPRDQTCIS